MLPRFELVHRSRPVRLVADERRSGFLAPFAAIEAELAGRDLPGRLGLGFATPDGRHRTAWWDGGRRLAGLEVGDARGVSHRARSRRHGRAPTPPEAVAATLTGRQLSVLTRDAGRWTVRGRTDVGEVAPEGLEVEVTWLPRDGAGAPPWRSGTFGQLGVRDVRLVTHAEGEPVVEGGRLLLTMAHAGPGFFDTAHTGVWSFDPETCAIEHRADLWFRRGGRVRGDHATHLVRHEGRWLVATSTWGDFDGTHVGVVLATSEEDLLHGEHVLDAAPVALPGTAVGTWDPHLTLIDGHWHLAHVAARRFFEFHPVLLRAADPGRLDGWQVLGAATDRLATEGPALVRLDGVWRVVASDGRDNPAPVAGRFPVFDLTMREVGALDAPYPSNLPWPALARHAGGWVLPTFDGTPYGGEVPGYGTHGDFLVLRTGT
ncbi:hypothetical protein [Nocardioides donggukensis]|uniref:Uncharacterized protein n=1 Tax=Nocardioides donggukensis TaxID=2774019 RepID=A0A927K195_9ACTN|nr:hypothetical protein [Nocardioides donggukensis]MBD8868287.1 hypothetical protein [Nocardioides donggukensis]